MADKPKVEIYGTEHCGYCTAARMLFTKKGVEFSDVLVSRDRDALQKMMELSGRRSVPQIFINDRHVGGFDDVLALEEANELDELLVMPQDAADA